MWLNNAISLYLICLLYKWRIHLFFYSRFDWFCLLLKNHCNLQNGSWPTITNSTLPFVRMICLRTFFARFSPQICIFLHQPFNGGAEYRDVKERREDTRIIPKLAMTVPLQSNESNVDMNIGNKHCWVHTAH